MLCGVPLYVVYIVLLFVQLHHYMLITLKMMTLQTTNINLWQKNGKRYEFFSAICSVIFDHLTMNDEIVDFNAHNSNLKFVLLYHPSMFLDRGLFSLCNQAPHILVTSLDLKRVPHIWNFGNARIFSQL